ncbi:hypothetical protein B0T16DRAFT_159163 [Cercophora newfieldiana]|uniref:Uncharacterized protein n=1 Tax=Cercophora newfieldiana TaxID=92897 RepID=A0AA40CRC1_9PEZI|nr:hypothetical protein B0T16DRAFT_159163 [Cercophora newfieldiana]
MMGADCPLPQSGPPEPLYHLPDITVEHGHTNGSCPYPALATGMASAGTAVSAPCEVLANRQVTLGARWKEGARRPPGLSTFRLPSWPHPSPPSLRRGITRGVHLEWGEEKFQHWLEPSPPRPPEVVPFPCTQRPLVLLPAP